MKLHHLKPALEPLDMLADLLANALRCHGHTVLLCCQHLHDLAADPQYTDICRQCEGELRDICDPEAVNRMAFEDQRRMVAALGGPEALARLQTFDFTPVPG